MTGLGFPTVKSIYHHKKTGTVKVREIYKLQERGLGELSVCLGVFKTCIKH